MLAAAALAASCSEPPIASRSTARDSAGVRIVDNARPVWGPSTGWRIGANPVLDLGGPDSGPEYQFEQISHVAVHGNGTIAVADMAAREVHFFDPSGKPLAVRGGPGKGPGEFDFLWGLAVLGNRAYAYDPRSARLTVFDSVGTYLEIVTLDEPEGYRPMFEYYLVGARASDLVFSPRVFTPGFGEGVSAYRDSSPNLAFSPSGGFKEEVAEPSGADMFVGPQGGSSVPFSTISLIAVDEDRVFMSQGKGFEVRVYSDSGPPSAIYRRSHTPRPVTDEDLQNAIAAHLRMAGAASPRDPRFEGFIRMMESAPLPPFMPSMDRLLVDELGFLWCREYHPPYEEDPTQWTVFSPGGDWLGELTFPAGFSVGVIGPDYVLGVFVDPLDVQHIWKLPLTRSQAVSWSVRLTRDSY